jgi:hypothetical protein
MNDVELRWKEINSFFKPEDVKVTNDRPYIKAEIQSHGLSKFFESQANQRALVSYILKCLWDMIQA